MWFCKFPDVNGIMRSRIWTSCYLEWVLIHTSWCPKIKQMAWRVSNWILTRMNQHHSHLIFTCTYLTMESMTVVPLMNGSTLVKRREFANQYLARHFCPPGMMYMTVSGYVSNYTTCMLRLFQKSGGMGRKGIKLYCA